MKGLIFGRGRVGGAYNRTKKSVSKQALSLFSWSINQNVNVRDTQLTMRMTEDARQERHEKRERLPAKPGRMGFHGIVIFLV